MSARKTTPVRTEEDRAAAAAYQQALQPIEPQPVAEVQPSGEANVAALLQLSINQGMAPEAIEKLVNLYERLDARRAEREFAAALLAFQNECSVIVKNRTAGAGSYKYDYASLDALVATIRPHVYKHGLSYTFDGGVASECVRVVTILRHIGGHQERTTFEAPIDKGARMNVMQQVASATSYARRYGLLLALGLATGEDDDGHGTTPIASHFVTEEEFQRMADLVAETATKPEDFAAFMGVESLREISRRDYPRAVAALEAKKRRNANGGAQ